MSGTVIAPVGGAPADGHPVVAWAHPTTGAAQACAPSLFVDPFILIEGLHGFLTDGDVVVATDYSGMGAEGPPSYLIGKTEGNNVLDAVRAARSIREAHAGERLLLWGHSQGGQATLFAAHEAAKYAPELHLVGIAVAAPAVELGSLLRDDVSDYLGVGLGAFAFVAYQEVYGEGGSTPALTTILTSAGAAATPKMAATCTFPSTTDLKKQADSLVGNYLSADPSQVAPWKVWLDANVPASDGYSVPILIAQGVNDKLVHVATTDEFVRNLCAHHQRVFYDQLPDASHATVGFKARPAVRRWFADLLAGRSVVTTCN